MKFIYADSLDYVDPNYDFLTDSYGEGRQPYWDDRFSHEMLTRAPYDGILVSRATVGSHLGSGKYTESQRMRFTRVGAHDFLRFNAKRDESKWLFGDCGAFSYHKLDVPPYTPEDTLGFYADGGFSHGCSVDHVIFEFTDNRNDMSGGSENAKFRYEITLDNAQTFLTGSHALGPHFTPIGVVQGWSPYSMAKAAESLIEMGYTFIAMGGMVPLRVPAIHSCLQALRDRIGTRSDIKLHLLGFAKADNLHEFTDYGVTSFDSSSPMVRAFKDASKNYYALNANKEIVYYSAIRIPQSTENRQLRNHTKTGRYLQESLVSMESHALQMMRGYGAGNTSLADALDAILKYSIPLIDDGKIDQTLIQRRLDQKRIAYGRTLKDRPWDSCPCNICKTAGIETVIFRASNRNKRRGMHNLSIFYQYLQGLNN